MANAYDTCAICGTAMTHPQGRGKAKKYCGDVCQQAANAERERGKVYPACSVGGCDRPASRKAAKMCEKHYYRVRRTGKADITPVEVSHATKKSSDPKIIPHTVEHSHGYLLEYAPDHPLATSSHPRVYQHRIVYYRHHGAGPFHCKWCGCVVTWNDMHVDHLDDDKQNNDITNLAASCATCNQSRGHWKIRRHHRDKTGIRIGDEVHTLNEWAAIVGISRNSITSRIAKGWDVERAILEPRGKFGPKSQADHRP